MKNLKTNDDLIKELLTPDEQQELTSDIEQAVIKYHGGFREGAGRKKKNPSLVLKFQIRVSEKEKEFLAFARKHNLDYDKLMGQY